MLRPSGGPEINVTVAACRRLPCALAVRVWFCEQLRSAREVTRSIRSSIRRLCKHRVVPPDVLRAEDPVLRPSGGPEIDVTVAACHVRSRVAVRTSVVLSSDLL